MKKTIIAGIGGAAIAAALGLAAPAQAGPCSYLNDTGNDGPDNSICGVPSLTGTAENALANLHKNLSTGNAIGNLQGNLDAGNAIGNLQKNLSGDIE